MGSQRQKQKQGQRYLEPRRFVGFPFPELWALCLAGKTLPVQANAALQKFTRLTVDPSESNFDHVGVKCVEVPFVFKNQFIPFIYSFSFAFSLSKNGWTI
jgi:hypothetical protein